MTWREKLLLALAILWDGLTTPKSLPMPDLKDAKGRRYDTPDQEHAPADAPHIADAGKL